MKDTGTRNAIFTLRMICERFIEMQKDIYLYFIDYTKAFDKVKHVQLLDMLQDLDIDGKDIQLLKNLYREQTAGVKIEDRISTFEQIKRGVRQGCVLSPDLFNLYSEQILRSKKTECMVASKKLDVQDYQLTVGATETKQVEKFSYLGSLMTSDGRSDSEIKKRIGCQKLISRKWGRYSKIDNYQ